MKLHKTFNKMVKKMFTDRMVDNIKPLSLKDQKVNTYSSVVAQNEKVFEKEYTIGYVLLNRVVENKDKELLRQIVYFLSNDLLNENSIDGSVKIGKVRPIPGFALFRLKLTVIKQEKLFTNGINV